MQTDHVVAVVEGDFSLTLQQLSERIVQEFEMHISKSTIGSYLKGRIITLKKAYAMPATMNTHVNKML